jgi:predicted amidophosphoribosyltransferase
VPKGSNNKEVRMMSRRERDRKILEEWEDPYYYEEYCWYCCNEFNFDSSKCPDCDCDEIYDAMIEGDEDELVEECIDEFDCPLDDWDDV